MHFFYADSPDRTPYRGPPISSLDPNRGYVRHYENYLFLRLVQRNGTPAERWQASKEIEVCQQKLDWWRHRGGWSLQETTKLCAQLRRDWQVPDTEVLP